MKNHEMIHFIQGAGLQKDAEKVVVRLFNMMNEVRDHNGCLSMSVALCIALEYLEYEPRLCIGKFWVSEHDYYHAWIELDEIIIDVAIYGNTLFSQYWIDGVINPQINKAYSETDIKYEPFAFDEEFEEALISKAMGLTFYTYCENAPGRNAMWNMILYCLGSSSLATLNKIKEIAKRHKIGERS